MLIIIMLENTILKYDNLFWQSQAMPGSKVEVMRAMSCSIFFKFMSKMVEIAFDQFLVQSISRQDFHLGSKGCNVSY